MQDSKRSLNKFFEPIYLANSSYPKTNLYFIKAVFFFLKKTKKKQTNTNSTEGEGKDFFFKLKKQFKLRIIYKEKNIL